MGFHRFLGSFFLIMGFLAATSQAYKFYVGGRDGWVLNPTENYTHWAHRNRFQVNDTLYFKYKKGSDSVLVVNREDYYSCNAKNPKQTFTDGDAIFVFDHSGPFYFISGNSDNCNNGQKLFVIVMAIRPKPHQSPPHQAPPMSPSSPLPPATSPPLLPPPVESPVNSSTASNAPPSHSGSQSSAGFVRLALGASFGVILLLGGFVGIV